MSERKKKRSTSSLVGVGSKRRRSDISREENTNWMSNLWNKLWGISSPSQEKFNGSPRKRRKSRGRSGSSKSSPKTDKKEDKLSNSKENEDFLIDHSPPKPKEIKANTIDLFSALEQKIQDGLTPEEQNKLFSSLQGSPIQQKFLNQQTPVQSHSRNGNQSFSTPQFRLSTPIRPYTNPIQRLTPIPQGTSPLKRPLPVYAPMTPTQYIKNTAFRSSVKRRNTPSSERRRSSLFSGSSSSYPDMFMQNTMPSEEDSNEPPRKKRLIYKDSESSQRKPSYAMDVAINIFDAIDRISSPLVPSKSSVEEIIRQKYIEARSKQDEIDIPPPVKDISNQKTQTNLFENDTSPNRTEKNIPSITVQSSRLQRMESNNPYSRRKKDEDDDDEEEDIEYVEMPKKDTKSFSFSTAASFKPITPDSFGFIADSSQSQGNSSYDNLAIPSYPSITTPIEFGQTSPSNEDDVESPEGSSSELSDPSDEKKFGKNEPILFGETSSEGEDDDPMESSSSNKEQKIEEVNEKPAFSFGSTDCTISFDVPTTFKSDFSFGNQSNNEDNSKQQSSSKFEEKTSNTFTFGSSTNDIKESEEKPAFSFGSTDSSVSFDISSNFGTPTFGTVESKASEDKSEKITIEDKETKEKNESSFSFGSYDSSAPVSFKISNNFGQGFTFGTSDNAATEVSKESEEVVEEVTEKEVSSSKDEEPNKENSNFSFGSYDSSTPVSFKISNTFGQGFTFGSSDNDAAKDSKESEEATEKEVSSSKDEESKPDSSKLSFGSYDSSAPVSFKISNTFGQGFTFGSSDNDSSSKDDIKSESEEKENEDKKEEKVTITLTPEQKQENSATFSFGSSGTNPFSFGSSSDSKNDDKPKFSFTFGSGDKSDKDASSKNPFASSTSENESNDKPFKFGESNFSFGSSTENPFASSLGNSSETSKPFSFGSSVPFGSSSSNNTEKTSIPFGGVPFGSFSKESEKKDEKKEQASTFSFGSTSQGFSFTANKDKKEE